jgi:hypothetical protein
MKNPLNVTAECSFESSCMQLRRAESKKKLQKLQSGRAESSYIWKKIQLFPPLRLKRVK